MNFNGLTEFLKNVDHNLIHDCEIVVFKEHKCIYKNRFTADDVDPSEDKKDMYYLFSATKVITATATMRLVEEGKIGLDDPVKKYLPEFAELYVLKGGEKVKAKNVLTVRHLLSMQGGFNYNLGHEEIVKIKEQSGNMASTREVVSAIAKMPLVFEPGENYLYSLCHDVLAAVVEIVVCKDAKCRYSTIQNWSTNIVNLVTKRALVEEEGLMEWIDGNIGSKINMKYPACILKGDNSKGECVSIAMASEGQVQDTGAKMIHLAPHTKSNIISKSIARNGGNATYRGKVYIDTEATNSVANVKCDTLILDEISKSDTIPVNTCRNVSSNIEHEATVSKISEEQLFYLMSRGINEKDATQMILMGFIEPFSKELPMEYAVELNQLIKMDMEGSVG